MTAKYRRADDNRWWPVHGRHARPMPHVSVEVKLKDGRQSDHAGLDRWDGTIWGFDIYGTPFKAAESWRYKLPPAVRWPGDMSGTWHPAEEEYDDGPEVEAAGREGAAVEEPAAPAPPQETAS